MEITYKVVGACCVLTLSSDDGYTSCTDGDILRVYLVAAISEREGKRIVVDLSRLRFVHSAVTVSLIRMIKILHGCELKNAKLSPRGNIVLCVSSLETDRLEATGLSRYFPLFYSLEDALDFFNREGAND